jgi:myosin heavy subunit
MIVALEWMVCGYPCRVSFEELWKRYGHLLPPVMRCAVTPDEFARLVFLVIGTNSSDFQLGKTFAFFRLGSLYVRIFLHNI